MDTIRIAGFVAGLLPLQAKRDMQSCKRPQGTLIAHREWGMPDARDLPALLLCSDATWKETPRVVPNQWVSRDSLMRVATLVIERCHGQKTYRISVAESWDDEGVVLSSEFVALRADSGQCRLPLQSLVTLSPGALALIVALSTTEMTSLGHTELARCIGSRNASPTSLRQQLRSWLRLIGKIVPEWTYDSVSKAFFRRAKRPFRRTGEEIPRTATADSVPSFLRFTKTVTTKRRSAKLSCHGLLRLNGRKGFDSS